LCNGWDVGLEAAMAGKLITYVIHLRSRAMAICDLIVFPYYKQSEPDEGK